MRDACRTVHRHRVTPPSSETTDQDSTDRLSAGLHRCLAEFVADVRLCPDDGFTPQLQSIVQGRVEVDVTRTIPTASGFVTEHVETQHTPNGVMTARRLHLCEVADGSITAVTTYRNGGWDAELRARHGASARMVRP